MLRAVLIAAALLPAAPAQAGSYNDPLAFGMTREQVEHVAQARDADALAQRVDFPKLRRSMAEQILQA